MEKIKQNKDFGYLLNRLIAKPRNKKPGSSGYIPPTLLGARGGTLVRWYGERYAVQTQATSSIHRPFH